MNSGLLFACLRQHTPQRKTKHIFSFSGIVHMRPAHSAQCASHFLSQHTHTHTHTHTHMLTDKHKIYVHHKAKLQAGGTVSFSTTEHFQWKWEVLEQKKEPPKVTAQM